MTGLDTIRAIRHAIGEQLPAVVISADRSSAVRRAIEADGLKLVSKPVRSADLISSVDALVALARPAGQRTRRSGIPSALAVEVRAEANADIAVIEDEASVRDALRQALEADGYKVATFPSGEVFWADDERGRFRCLVVDLDLPGMSGLRCRTPEAGALRHADHLRDRERISFAGGEGDARGCRRLPAEADTRRGVA